MHAEIRTAGQKALLFILTTLFGLTLMQCSLWQTKQLSDLELADLQSIQLSFQSHIAATIDRSGRSASFPYVRYQLPVALQEALRNAARDDQAARSGKQSPPRTKGRIRSCYLQHGAGVNQGLVESNLIGMDRFTAIYFGPHTVSALLAQICDSVYVVRQDSVQSSILEMTRRTEEFLKNEVCRANDTERDQYEGRICAFIGHSKGGAVAFNLARRCMQKTSLLEARGCRHLVEVYSAAGIIQGAMLSFLGYGVYIGQMQGEQDTLQKVLGFGIDLVADFYQAYVPGVTNPVWLDLSPAAPLEDGRPIYQVNNITLMRSGWFQGDFAATGVDFHFSGDADQGLYGCDPQLSWWSAHGRACENFGASLGQVHASRYQSVFAKGLYYFKKDPRFFDPAVRNSNYLESMSWAAMQHGDGLADYQLSLAACFKGLQVKNSGLRAVQRCIAYKDLNHLANAGGSPQALKDMLFELGH
ncbi:MAG: hypothetical protein KDK39_12155 [Leptospiraceae bacterium]|nr:hypothetical protein [Leptospiraceae bacterium]